MEMPLVLVDFLVLVLEQGEAPDRQMGAEDLPAYTRCCTKTKRRASPPLCSLA